MAVSIYFSDTKGELAINKYGFISDLPNFNSSNYIQVNNCNIHSTAEHGIQQLNIGDVFFNKNSKWIVVISYYDVSFSRMSNYNWSNYIKHILRILSIKLNDELHIYLTNMKNQLQEYQSFNNQVSIVNDLMEHLTIFSNIVII